MAAELAFDLFAGSIGGAAGVVIGHPLDIIKVRYQMMMVETAAAHQSASSSSMKIAGARGVRAYAQVAAGIWSAQGLKGFFRGLAPPVCGQALYTASCFAGFNGCLGAMKRAGIIETTRADRAGHGAVYLAGCGAGMLTTFVNVPCELVKIKLQVDMQSGISPRYSGPLACARDLVRRGGGLRALYSGWAATALRDTPSTGLYFLSYHACKTKFQETETLGRTGSELIAGGIAGVLSWGSAVPLDVVKTQIQADAGSRKPKYDGVVDCVRRLYAEQGAVAFSRGALPVIVRSFPVNAVTFFVYERVLDFVASFSRPLL